MSQTSSTSDIYRGNISRGADRPKARGNFNVEQELYDLCNLSGVTLDPDVFQIILDLIQVNVSPNALVQVLKKMSKQTHRKVSIESVTPSIGYAHSEGSKSLVNNDSAIESSKGSVFRDETTAESEKSSKESLASRLRAIKAGRKAT